jgi:hypothetical protein
VIKVINLNFNFDQISDFTMFRFYRLVSYVSGEIWSKSPKMTPTHLDRTHPKLSRVCSPALTDSFAGARGHGKYFTKKYELDEFPKMS